MVMYRRMYTATGMSAKLLSSWLGPYRIVEVVSPQNVIIRPREGLVCEDKRVHVEQVKRYVPAVDKPVRPRLLKVGDIVRAKAKYSPYWPARIVDEAIFEV